MGCADSLSRGSAHPISVLSRLVAGYLCHFALTCGCTFSHYDDVSCNDRYTIIQRRKLYLKRRQLRQQC